MMNQEGTSLAHTQDSFVPPFSSAVDSAPEPKKGKARKTLREPKSEKKVVNPIPVLVQTTLSFSWGLVLITGIIVALISSLSGCEWMELLVRTGAAIIISGIILWIFSWIVTLGAVEIARQQTIIQLDDVTPDHDENLKQDIPGNKPEEQAHEEDLVPESTITG